MCIRDRNFTDAQAPRTIEVVDYDEATATALPLKVQFLQGKWVIASHYNYLSLIHI